MRFDRGDGTPISAAVAWHDAFYDGVTSIDYRDVLETFGVQFTARGADNKIMDHVEKGLIQQAVAKLKVTDPVAWAWGMIAYAPDNTVALSEIDNRLLPYIFTKIATEDYSPFQDAKAGRLYMIALSDSRIEAWTCERVRRNGGMYMHIGVTPEVYKKTYSRMFGQMKDLMKDLGGRALPPISSVMYDLIDQSGGGIYGAIANEDLQERLMMPAGAWV